MLLTIVALVPLLVVLAFNIIGAVRLRTQNTVRRVEGMAQSQAEIRETQLVADVQRMLLVVEESEVQQVVGVHPRRLSPAELGQRDKAWPILPLTDAWMSAVLYNPAAERFRHVQRNDPRILKMLLTDRYGQTVASTDRTGHFYQANEDWWQRAYGGGKGRVVVEEVAENVQETYAPTLDLGIPVKSGDEIIGVAKVQLDVSQWVQGSGGVGEPLLPAGARLMLIKRDGQVVYRPGGGMSPGRLARQRARNRHRLADQRG